jgi:hypothetical protein
MMRKKMPKIRRGEIKKKRERKGTARKKLKIKIKIKTIINRKEK